MQDKGGRKEERFSIILNIRGDHSGKATTIPANFITF